MKSGSKITAIRALSLVLAALSVLFSSHAFARGSLVSYTPQVQQMEGTMAFTYTQALTVRSPVDLPAGSSVPITFRIDATSFSFGTAEQALSYVTISPATLTFTDPNQALTVDVTVSVPALALPSGTTSANLAYQIYALGWPTSSENGGATLQVVAQRGSGAQAAPPVLVINNPADQLSISFRPEQMPAPLSFDFVATASDAAPITAINADCGTGAVVTMTSVTGLGTAQVTASGTIVLSKDGHFALTAWASNSGGTVRAQNQFDVTVLAPPPVVAFTSPLPDSTFTYRTGGAPVAVPVNFTATSAFGGIASVSATLDGVAIAFIPSGLGTLVASGTLNLAFNAAGDHTVTITAVDTYGTTKQDLKFTVVAVSPEPVVTFTAPVSGVTLFTAAGASTVAVPFNFSTTCLNGFVADAVSANLDGNPVAIDSTLGVGTPATVSTGTLPAVGAGTHTLSATVTSAGVVATTTTSFTVKLMAAMPAPPSVTVTAPTAAASFTRLATDPVLNLPLSFTATSSASDGTITAVNASLDGTPIAVTATLGSGSVTGTATLTVAAAGTHTVVVSAADGAGTGSATQTFTLTVDKGRTVAGRVFFDPDRDGAFNSLDFGLAGREVGLWTNGRLYSTMTANDGSYIFTNLPAGTGYVGTLPELGLVGTTSLYRTVTISDTAATADFGLMLDFAALRMLRGDGYTVPFWTTNLQEALSPSAVPAQVPATTITEYTSTIGSFGLTPFDKVSTKGALAVLTVTNPTAAAQLSAQLLAAEYNYARGGYINGDRALTFVFVWWGEYVLSHPQTYTATDMVWVGDWLAAFNRSRGGFLKGPADTAHRFSP